MTVTITALLAAVVTALAGTTAAATSAATTPESAAPAPSPTGPSAAPASPASCTRTVSSGLGGALQSLRPGDVLCVRGGTYTENISLTATPGTAGNRVTVRAYPGERPVVQGLLWVKGASYWTFDGINVTWASGNSSGQHMVKMTDGTGWRITNAEIWGARSYAGVLVAGTAKDWTIDRSYIHDTHASNGTNQDHLVYVNSSGPGLIERNLLARSPNGRGVKIGPSTSSTTPVGNVTVRYNTMQDNMGPSNVQLSYGATGNKIYRNIMVGSSAANVTAYNLNGSGNSAYENVGQRSTRVADAAIDGGRNVMVDPNLDPATFAPRNAEVTAYGAKAP